MRVARMVLEPLTLQPQSLGHSVQLLQAEVSQVVGSHVTPIWVATWAGLVFTNLVNQYHSVFSQPQTTDDSR